MVTMHTIIGSYILRGENGACIRCVCVDFTFSRSSEREARARYDELIDV